MIYAFSESGWTDAKYIGEFFANRNSLQPYGRALLALALEARGDKRAATVAGEIESSAVASEGVAHWSSRSKSHGMDQPNDVEATSLSLKALSRLTPQSSLLPKAARWLVSNRKYGAYWQSTKETAVAIYGLTDYLKVSQELSPDYSVEVYVNGQQMLTHQMTAADASTGQSFVIQRRGGGEVANANEVKIVKHGHGTLYLLSTLVTYTNDEDVPAQSTPQLRLSREYLRLKIVDGKDGQPEWKTEALSGDLHSGDLIVSKLYVEGAQSRYLMIEDPIPAGCEQVESVSGIDLNYSSNGWSDWYSSREFRDNRAVFFLNYFQGKASYQYAMRVQVPGQFRIAPARVEQMYQPSVQANTTNGRMNILDAQ
jgi:uncharacterized protein YfaS (alpha-2-macroglobulin family)